MKLRHIIPLFIVMFMGCSKSANLEKVLQVPGRDQFCKIDVNGVSVLPSGRYVSPAGELLRITHDPFGMAISPDGKKCITLHNGVFTIIDIVSLDAIRVPSYDGTVKSPLSRGSFLGVAFASDSRTVYLSGGDNGAVIAYDIENLVKLDSISLNGKVEGVDYQDSFTSDLLLNEDENELLVLDRGNFRMVRIDLSTKKAKTSVQVGRQPSGP